MIQVQLAGTYDPQRWYSPKSWSATPKLDGVRGVYVPGEGFLSRTGQKFQGFDQCAKRLDEVAEKCRFSFLDGELILPGRSFQDIQGVVTAREHPEKESTEFHVFALGGVFRDTAAMTKAVSSLEDLGIAGVHGVRAMEIPNDPDAVEKACTAYVSQGFEGVMLRDPRTPYAGGRGSALLKFKPFREADLNIVGIYLGEGRFAGLLGGVEVAGEAEGRMVRCKVGTGFLEEDRRRVDWWSGKVGNGVLSVKYQSLTDRPDRTGVFSLRFPSALGVKVDR